jgi:hypothetical protein
MPGQHIGTGLPSMSPFIGGQSGARHSPENSGDPILAAPPSGVAFSIARRTVTFVQRPSVDDDANQPANDNSNRATEAFSVLDLISSADDDQVAAVVRRTERLAIAVVIGMAICLILAPVVYFALAYGI